MAVSEVGNSDLKRVISLFSVLTCERLAWICQSDGENTGSRKVFFVLSPLLVAEQHGPWLESSGNSGAASFEVTSTARSLYYCTKRRVCL